MVADYLTLNDCLMKEENFMKYIYSFFIVSFALILSGVSDNVRAQSILDAFGDWTAYTVIENKIKRCYIQSTPTRLEPGSLRHGNVYFFVSIIPELKVKGQPYLKVGYPFQKNSTVSINIGGKTYKMFTEADGAWIAEDSAESELVQSMIDGNTMTVSGVSGRGNKTSYRFSLSGVTKAFAEAKNAC